MVELIQLPITAMPETLSSTPIYKGRIFDVRVDDVRNGEDEYKREVVVHRGSAVIVPVFEDKTIAMVRQYRHAANEYLLEIPAGSLDKGETSPEACAHRELEEEIGVVAGRMEEIASFYVSPGFLTEKMFVYLATELTETQQDLEIDEILEVERHSFSDVFEMIRNGGIQDAKTMLGLIFAGPRFGYTF
jgi:ADP-ribose pyrophosphatase